MFTSTRYSSFAFATLMIFQDLRSYSLIRARTTAETCISRVKITFFPLASSVIVKLQLDFFNKCLCCAKMALRLNHLDGGVVFFSQSLLS